MKISIITVAYNAAATIEDTFRSVQAQDYGDVEYIVVDGASKDGTLDLCDRYSDLIDVLISEPDKGIYDAMNKGLAAATGDYIGILNSDDFYAGPGVLSAVAEALQSSGSESLFGDLVMVSPDNLDKVTRYYQAKDFELKRFEKGDMPPHPTFFVKREVYDRLGHFSLKYSICSDFELMLRFLYIGKISYTYLPLTMIKMRAGGVSTSGVKATMEVNSQIKAALNDNGIKTSTLKVYSKYFQKIFQLVKRPGKA